MKFKESAPFLKIVLMIGLGYYLYRTAKKNGGTLSNNPDGLKVMIDTDMAVDTVLSGIVSEKSMPLIKNTAKIIMNKYSKTYGINQQKL